VIGTAPHGGGATIKPLLKRNEFYLAALIFLLCIAITAANPSFLTLENVLSFLKTSSVNGILAVGVLFVLILGGTPDVSFTAIAQVVEYVVVMATLRWGGDIALALLGACVLGALMGSVNGFIIHYFRVTTIVVTIATLNVYYGMLYVLTGGNVIFVVHPMFKQFASILLFPMRAANGSVYGVSMMPVMWLGVLILGWFILRRTFLGRAIFAMGGNEVAAERIGVNTLWTRVFVFSFVGLLSGVAAIAHATIVLSAIPNIIVGHELEVIAAVVLGGASLFGGKGTIIGTFLGVLLFAVLKNGLVLLNFSSYWYDVTIGVAITVGITVSAYQQQRAERSRVNVEVEPVAAQ
jgi:simple sugar transport system permease protein